VPMHHAALFIEFSGVLCAKLEEGPGAHLPFTLLPGVGDTLRTWHQRGIVLVALVDVPSADQARIDAITAGLVEACAAGGSTMSGCSVCTSRSPASWIRPRPGMLLSAARHLEIDLARSWLIGTQERDAIAAAQAGCSGCVLVGAAPPAVGELGIVVNAAQDLQDAARVLIPRGGGCWHQHG
jgi:histidinol phosphatase-like enzyme